MTARPAVPTAALARWSLVLLGLLAMGRSLGAGWVQDDPPLIQGNPAVHQWSGLWTGFTEPYWPPPSEGALYRPLARAFHTLQWMVGEGHLWVFRVTDLALYLLLVLAVHALAREWLDARRAWIAAALFAVHPVHVEAVAVAVNQGELIVAILAAWSGLVWSRWRRGELSDRGAAYRLGGALLVGLGFKEHALIVPALLAAWELVRPAPGAARRWRTLAGLVLLGAGWWLMRTAVLGSLAGAAPVEGLRDAGAGARALTMLGVVPEWARLLFWPAHLQADYSPWELAPWHGWSAAQGMGTALVVAALAATLLAWRRSPPAAFALVWTMVALAPVSNLVLPTGILLAERTLLLPSIGAVLLVAALLPVEARTPALRRLIAGGVALVLLLGVVASARRFAVWRDLGTFLAALAVDAPRSWRTQVALGIAAREGGRPAVGDSLFAAAHAAWPASPRPLQLRAFYARLEGDCARAVPLLEAALLRRPGDRWTRLPLVACLLDQGRYGEARAFAVADTAPDEMGRALLHAAAVADSAAADSAPPGTVRLPAVRGGLTIIGPRR